MQTRLCKRDYANEIMQMRLCKRDYANEIMQMRLCKRDYANERMQMNGYFLLYYEMEQPLDLFLEEIKRIFTKERWERANKYFQLADRNRTMLAEVLLRKVLRQYLGEKGSLEPFCYNPYGKPLFENKRMPHFNLTHSWNWVGCAISDGPVGMDLEWIKDADLNLAKRFFAKEETDYIFHGRTEKSIVDQRESMEERFYRIWTLKESYVKYKGMGLHIPLNSFIFQHKDGEFLVENEDNVRSLSKIQKEICIGVTFDKNESGYHEHKVFQNIWDLL